MEPYYETKKHDGNLTSESESADSDGKKPMETATGVEKALDSQPGVDVAPIDKDDLRNLIKAPSEVSAKSRTKALRSKLQVVNAFAG